MAPVTRRPGHSRRAHYSIFFAYVLAVAGATLGAVLLALSIFDPPAFAALRSAATEVTSPVASGLGAARRTIAAAPNAIGDYIDAGNQNADLRRRLAAQTRDIRFARGAVLENARLKRLVALREGSDAVVTTARIVSSTPGSVRRFGTLNAGRMQGVRPGQPVLGVDGLVGRVIETGPTTARVMLAIDADSVVPVQRTRDGLPAFAYGTGDGQVELRAVTSASNAFRRGDVFVTSGAGGIFPAAIPVARVSRPAGDTAIGRPFADPDALDFAIVRQQFVPAPPPLRAPGTTDAP